MSYNKEEKDNLNRVSYEKIEESEGQKKELKDMEI